MLILKNDRFRRSRGGQAQFLDISCAKCNALVLVYQKDGTGELHRCYLNRIFYPPVLEHLQYDSTVQTSKDFEALFCPKCNQLIGCPMLHHEGRLAFRLLYGTYKKTKHKELP